MIKVEFDAGAFLDLEDLDEDIQDKLEIASKAMIDKMYELIREKANASLNTSKQTYLGALSQPKKVGLGQWEIDLDDEAAWIENGIPAGFDMLPGLLASPKAKYGKNGKYIIVPFNHSKIGAAKTSKSTALTNQLKVAMKNAKIPFRKIEKDINGTPKQGLLHKMDVQTTPQHKKKSKKDQQPLGHPLISKPEGRSYLQGVRVYQKTTGPRGKVEKSNMTFRIASEKHSGQKWIHPGTTGLHAFDDANQFASENWEDYFENA